MKTYHEVLSLKNKINNFFHEMSQLSSFQLQLVKIAANFMLP